MSSLVDTVGDAPLPSHLPDSTADVRMSYDDLRRVNRAEHEKKRHESLSHPPPEAPAVSTTRPTAPPKPRKLQQIAQWHII